MGAIADVVASTGVLKGHCRRAVDSTVLDDAVARQDTGPQLIAAVRRFGRDVPDGKELTAAHATGYDYTRTGKPDIAWDDEEAKECPGVGPGHGRDSPAGRGESGHSGR